MTLSKYNQKRRFDETSEPKGKSAKNTGALRFVIQKHDASHLHYDFRLELDGVLKSWAIPKGPSLNPADKRLAMQVEDHPFDYRTFEGTIPDGNYGAGEVIVWDEGTYAANPDADRATNEKVLRKELRDGNLKITLNGQKLHGQFGLIKIKKSRDGKDNAWLLVKDRDEYASDDDITRHTESVRSEQFLSRDQASNQKTAAIKKPASKKSQVKESPSKHARPTFKSPVKPMLATLIEAPFDKQGWIFEVKWDGYRAIAEVIDRDVNLYSRNNTSFINKYPLVVEALQTIRQNVVLDGEIVVLNEAGKTSFQSLQDYEHHKGLLVYMVFDILWLDGQDLRDLPLLARKKQLKKALPDNPHLRFSDHVEKNGEDFFHLAQKEGLEGVMAKDAQSPYITGKRTSYWLKIKAHRQQEAVICGYTAPKGARKNFGALILGVYQDKQLVYIGHTGTGFNTASLQELKAQLDGLTVKACPFETKPKTNAPVTWVKPVLVCEIKFQEWTQENAMRQPVYLGLRTDKEAQDVVREQEEATSKTINAVTNAKSKIALKHNPQPTQNKKAAKSLRLTHQDKVYWPESGLTKGDMIDYYRAISDIILPYLADRPLVLHRFPNGIETPGFYQKDNETALPDFVQTEKVYSESTDETLNMIVCQNQETLLYTANLGSIELNPWNSRKKHIEEPDYVIFDLDPGDIGFDKVIETALVIKDVLHQAGVASYCKTSGATGLHICVPAGTKYTYEQVKEFAHLVMVLVHERLPDFTSLERSPAKRPDKIYLDYLQNRMGQTMACVYGIRPRPNAPVSTPLAWKEVKPGLDPTQFTIQTIHKRLQKKGDLWEPVLGQPFDMKKALTQLQ